ncbi:YdhR family protein [Halomicroarcula limicola]|uniref:YdhR family protein n=1 Tax=Haloarcula limicola TaxID=1429915 RepID=A0A8J7YFH9_9EURY|nr:YdhR family protein [Halomicroarcula limicola]MBV0926271.1 YdhR family protein [Halomicroarcula limicola]
MEIVFITYESALAVDEIDSLFRERAERYRAMDGLLQKFYLRDEKNGRVGGIYVFESAASADALFESDIHASLREAYKVRDIDIARYQVMFPLYESADFPESP